MVLHGVKLKKEHMRCVVTWFQPTKFCNPSVSASFCEFFFGWRLYLPKIWPLVVSADFWNGPVKGRIQQHIFCETIQGFGLFPVQCGDSAVFCTIFW